MLRREINKSGKSRAFINDTPVKLPLMKELGEKLVDIHSQHETLLLNESGFQLAVLDNYADNQDLLSDYRCAYEEYISQQSRLNALISKEKNLRTEEDFIRFQFEEIDKAVLQKDELKGLEEELEMLEHAEEIKGSLYNAVQMLQQSDDSLIDRLSGLVSITGKVSDYHKEIKELHERLASSEIEIKDISDSLSGLEENISFDPARHEEISHRLDMIYGLLQKHKVKEIIELISLKEDLHAKLSSIENIDADIERLKKEVSILNIKLEKLSVDLRKKRQSVIPGLEKEIALILMKLGMEKVVVKVEMIDLEEYTDWGRDTVEFLFSANPGSPPAAVSKIASGGELSRLMLALKSLITKKNLLPTVILDEIDMGVSGEIAGKVGK
ncbi:MAG: DNA repair protein RecN, partial [Cyclobacteriaceae bacterium]|nr:DNA repair protein RecN [Cyclobacteriaceae bacterium]